MKTPRKGDRPTLRQGGKPHSAMTRRHDKAHDPENQPERDLEETKKQESHNLKT